MNSTNFISIIGATCLLLGAGCGDQRDATFSGAYRSALTGDLCAPDGATFMSGGYPEGTTFEEGKPWKPNKAEGLESNTTGINGDNMDDAHSGRTDCLGDGNSGHGDDKKHGCQFPQPGCDAEGCCETAEPPEEPEPEDEPIDDPPAQEEPVDDPPATEEPVDDTPIIPEDPTDCRHLDGTCTRGTLGADGECFALDICQSV